MAQKQLTDRQYTLLIKMALDFNAGVIALATAYQNGNTKKFIKEYQKKVNEYHDGIKQVLEMESQ